ncbi:hypothetical protein [Pigmentiphaga sp.]|uniref:hypothetical protein n=1 Tax=Pigmentiphaga sp. TaxID=1977564 RepID=UPI0025FDC214|nr:hypothetical protein [Pigmentiphaga sp.]
MNRLPNAHAPRVTDFPAAEPSPPSAPAPAAIPGPSHGPPYGRSNRDSHPDLRGFDPSRPAEETGSLLRYAQQRLARETDLLRHAPPQWLAPIQNELAYIGRFQVGRTQLEIRLHRQFIATAAINALAQFGGPSPQVLSSPLSQLSASLLASFPAGVEALKTDMGPDKWHRLHSRPEGANALLTLLLLRQELAAHDTDSLVACINHANNHGQNLLALANPDTAKAIPAPEDRIKIASLSGGWKNLDAGIAYLTEQSTHREHLLRQHESAAEPGTPVETIEHLVDQAMPPSLSIPRQNVLHLLSSPGGSAGLAAARAYQSKLSVQRAEIRQLLRDRMPDIASDDLDRAASEAVAPFTLSMEDLDSILSHSGGVNCLKAAEIYLTEQFAQHTLIRNRLTAGPDINADTIDHDVRLAMPPSLSLSKPEVLRILSYAGGAQSLAAAREYLDKLSGQRAQMRRLLQEEMPGLPASQLGDAADEAMARLTLPREDLPRLLSRHSGSGHLQAFSAYQTKLCEFYMAQRRTLRAGNPLMPPRAITQQLEQYLGPVMINADIAHATHAGGNTLDGFHSLLRAQGRWLDQAVPP